MKRQSGGGGLRVISRRSKSTKTTTKSTTTNRSKIDKLIELKIELIKLLLVAAEIATEAEVARSDS